MRQRVSTVLIVALLLSGGATYLVYRLLVANTSRAAQPTTRVVLASRPLAIGTLIRNEDLKAGGWMGTPPAGAVIKRESIVGRGVIAPIYEGEVVVESRLAPAGAGGGLAATIPPGMRACAVKVNEIVGLAGFVVPGMKVDVLIDGTGPGVHAEAGAQVKTILQNIQVLSAGQNFQKDAEGKPVQVQVVNLLVTPEEAELLSLANNETRVQLVLRNPLDTEKAKTPGTAMSTLFGIPKPAPVAEAPRPKPAPKPAAPAPVAALVAPPAPAPPYQIEVFNGAQRTEAKFARSQEDKK
jgi:pilus assembly protein CpaB